MKEIKLKLIASLLLICICSAVARAEEDVINSRWYESYYLSFCKEGMGKASCLERVGEYVAIKHIRANNDYYLAVIRERAKPLIKEYGLDNPDAQNSKKIDEVKRQVRRQIVEKIALDWLATGSLPVVSK